jgi:hypothetical protein
MIIGIYLRVTKIYKLSLVQKNNLHSHKPAGSTGEERFMGAALGTMTEIRELKTEITGLRTDLKRFIEKANQQHVDAVLGEVKKEYAGVFADHQVGTAKTDLSARMVEDCGMREKLFRAVYGVPTEFRPAHKGRRDLGRAHPVVPEADESTAKEGPVRSLRHLFWRGRPALREAGRADADARHLPEESRHRGYRRRNPG